MSIERDWDAIRGSAGALSRQAKIGLLRATLLFGSAAIALTLLITPLIAERSAQLARRPVLDAMSTGSVRAPTVKEYTLRRSVLQPAPDAVCRILPDGRRFGEC